MQATKQPDVAAASALAIGETRQDRRRNRLARASLVFGLLALSAPISILIPFIGVLLIFPLALICAPAGVVVALMALSKRPRPKEAIAGLLCSATALAMWILFLAVLPAVFSD